MESVSQFLAHAVVLEEEAAERYRQLAAAMVEHENAAIAELFRAVVRITRMQLEETLVRVREVGELPSLKPWEYEWPESQSPDVRSLEEESGYAMTPSNALRLALSAEQLALAFYAELARTAPNPL